jgi:hypothetical protein
MDASPDNQPASFRSTGRLLDLLDRIERLLDSLDREYAVPAISNHYERTWGDQTR